jgi:hypothetical protein
MMKELRVCEQVKFGDMAGSDEVIIRDGAVAQLERRGSE